MRKWVGDAEAHGMNLHMTTRGRREWGGGVPNTSRTTDNGGFRVIDSPSGQAFGAYRHIDAPPS